MNVVFFGNKKFKKWLDDYWVNKDYVYYEINNYKTSEIASHIHGDINESVDSLIFIPYFLYSYCENEGNLELGSFIANQIHLLPGKHAICMFTDLRCADLSSISLAYDGVSKFLNKLDDNYFYLDKHNYISISRTTKSWVKTLEDEINLTHDIIVANKGGIMENKELQQTLNELTALTNKDQLKEQATQNPPTIYGYNPEDIKSILSSTEVSEEELSNTITRIEPCLWCEDKSDLLNMVSDAHVVSDNQSKKTLKKTII